METFHQIIDSKVLSQVIELPHSLQDILVEITVMPVVVNAAPGMTRSQLRSQLHGSHTESLSGVLQSQAEVVLEDIRKERRTKYECFD